MPRTNTFDATRRERESSPRQVDIYSFGMFIYEMISLYLLFEKQPLISSHIQIEKLVIDGERPHRVRSCDLWM